MEPDVSKPEFTGPGNMVTDADLDIPPNRDSIGTPILVRIQTKKKLSKEIL